MGDYRICTTKGQSNEPAHDVDCGRISVVLGANGSGKSRLLARGIEFLRQKPGTKIVYVEGNRVFDDKLLSVTLDIQHGQLLDNPTLFDQTYRSHRTSRLAMRIKLALQTMRARDLQERERYVSDADAWHDNGQKGPRPPKPTGHIKTAFDLFSRLFPGILLRVTEAQQIYCKRNGEEYPVTRASDGEQQCLALICDILANPDDELTLLVDEPELHLNPLLACRLWSMLEAQLPKSQFIYATHCVSFAMRLEVVSLFALDYSGTLRELGSFHDLPREEQEQFLGAIPTVLSARFALAVEGRDGSFDAAFYPWVLERSDVAVVPMDGKQNVIGESSRLTLFSSLAPSARIFGIVDRDYDNTDGPSENIIELQYHEAESFLCDPILLARIANIISGKDEKASQADATFTIIEYAKGRAIKAIATHVFAQLPNRVGVALPSSAMQHIKSLDQLRDCLVQHANSKTEAFAKKLTTDSISKLITATEKRLMKAIEATDIKELLLLIEGKELIEQLLVIAGVGNKNTLLEACRKHLSPADFPALKDLRDTINAKFT